MTNLEKLQINIPKTNACSGLRVNKLWRMTLYLVVALFVLTILSLLPEIALAAKVGIDAGAKVATDSVIQNRLDRDGYWMKVAFLSGAAFFVIGEGGLRERAARFVIVVIAVSVLGKYMVQYDEGVTEQKIQRNKIEWQEKKGQLKEDPTPKVSES